MDIKSLVRKNIKNLKPYASAREEFSGRADIFLDANENPYGLDLNRYPDPMQRKLKEKISKIKAVPAKNIFLGNGSDEVIDLLIRIFCEPRKDEIILLPPTYGMYKVCADIANVGKKEVLLTPDFQPEVEAVLGVAGRNSKILFLCSPNNPTGNNFEFGKMVQLIENFPGMVVVDEAYIDFSTQKSAITLLLEYPNLVVMQTFSKAWGLAGLRLGMAFSSKEVVGFLNSVKPPYNINFLTQKTAEKILNEKQRVQENIQKILFQRRRLEGELRELKFVKKIHPSDANFLLVKVERADDLHQFLVERKIIVRNRSRVPLCEDCLRITVGTEEENERLLQELQLYQEKFIQ